MLYCTANTSRRFRNFFCYQFVLKQDKSHCSKFSVKFSWVNVYPNDLLTFTKEIPNKKINFFVQCLVFEKNAISTESYKNHSFRRQNTKIVVP